MVLAGVLDALGAARSVQEGLKDWPVHGGLLSQHRFWKLSQREIKRRREAAEQALAHADAQGFAGRQTVDRELFALLAAVRFEITGRTPRVRITRK